MITANALNFQFGGQILYENVSFDLHPGERIGLIGRNGTGKSTMLRLLAGQYEAGPALQKMRGLRTSFFNQDLLSFETDDNIVNVAAQAYAELIQKRNEHDALLEKMATDHSEAVLHAYSDLHEYLTLHDAFNIENNVQRTLAGLGFKPSDMEKSYSKFSGGWRMRVMLAKCLLEAPDLLMLDEPTNHLDLPAIQWLEGYLKNYPGTVILVSHDRRFLDQLCTRILELEMQQLRSYVGNYSQYEVLKAERLEQELKTYKNQQDKLRQEMRFIERFRSKASKAKAVQSRIKLIEKRELVNITETDNRHLSIRLKVNTQPGKILCELKHISKSYPDIEILNNANVLVERGDKIALIGPNGKGKSTLLRIIAGVESHSGERKPGHNVKMSYFAQHQLEALRLENEVLDEAQRLAHDRSVQEVRNTLGAFLFTDDDVFKKVKVLSGGEKARVALAGMMLSDANFLLLDEPTNHLDMDSVEMLVDALEGYEGSFICVSHDRFFLEQIANKIWYLQDGQIKVYPGGYPEFVQQYGEAFFLQQQQGQTEKKKAKSVAKPVANQEQKQALSPLQKEMTEAESKLTEIQTQKAALEQEMALPDVYSDNQKIKQLQQKMASVEQALEKQNALWESLFEKIAQIEEIG
jgi:ATP-binding cassette subfamily F protein 3